LGWGAAQHPIKPGAPLQLGHIGVVSINSVGIFHLCGGGIPLAINNIALGANPSLEAQTGQAQGFAGG
jgi:hypothetical protein